MPVANRDYPVLMAPEFRASGEPVPGAFAWFLLLNFIPFRQPNPAPLLSAKDTCHAFPCIVCQPRDAGGLGPGVPGGRGETPNGVKHRNGGAGRRLLLVRRGRFREGRWRALGDLGIHRRNGRQSDLQASIVGRDRPYRGGAYHLQPRRRELRRVAGGVLAEHRPHGRGSSVL